MVLNEEMERLQAVYKASPHHWLFVSFPTVGIISYMEQQKGNPQGNPSPVQCLLTSLLGTWKKIQKKLENCLPPNSKRRMVSKWLVNCSSDILQNSSSSTLYRTALPVHSIEQLSQYTLQNSSPSTLYRTALPVHSIEQLSQYTLQNSSSSTLYRTAPSTLYRTALPVHSIEQLFQYTLQNSSSSTLYRTALPVHSIEQLFQYTLYNSSSSTLYRTALPVHSIEQLFQYTLQNSSSSTLYRTALPVHSIYEHRSKYILPLQSRPDGFKKLSHLSPNQQQFIMYNVPEVKGKDEHTVVSTYQL